jgi:hypothetical protein
MNRRVLVGPTRRQRVRRSGQWIEIPNVIHVGRRPDALEALLRIKDGE